MDFETLLKTLDRDSRAILYNLWCRGHLNISQLRELTDSPTDFAILDRLKNIINRSSVEVLGRPLVGFYRCRDDPTTGQKVFFSWWYLDEGELLVKEDTFLDIFEEKDCVTIITQIKSPIDISKVELSEKNDLLIIRVRKMK